jgi:hypothetical protein
MARPKKVNLEEKVKEKIDIAQTASYYQILRLLEQHASYSDGEGDDKCVYDEATGRTYGGNVAHETVESMMHKDGEKIQNIFNDALKIQEMCDFLYDVISEIEEMREAHKKEILKIKGGGIEFDDKRRSGKDSGEPSKPRKLSTDEAQEKQESQGNGEIPDSDSDKDKDSQED